MQGKPTAITAAEAQDPPLLQLSHVFLRLAKCMFQVLDLLLCVQLRLIQLRRQICHLSLPLLQLQHATALITSKDVRCSQPSSYSSLWVMLQPLWSGKRLTYCSRLQYTKNMQHLLAEAGGIVIHALLMLCLGGPQPLLSCMSCLPHIFRSLILHLWPNIPIYLLAVLHKQPWDSSSSLYI